jgi:hypothetical protein
VRGRCPECGTSVAATLLLTVDPQAAELQPIRRPWLTAIGVGLWALGAVAAVVLIMWLRACEAFPAVTPPGWLVTAIVASVVCSGIGGLALVMPYHLTPRRDRVAALLASLLTFVLAAVSWMILVKIDGVGARPYLGGVASSPERWVYKLAVTGLLAAIVLGYRPTFHVLLARSHLIRSGRLERQTFRAVLASIGVMAIGDVTQIGAAMLQTTAGEMLSLFAMCIAVVGFLLFSAGILGMSRDVRQLLPVIVSPPLGIADVVGRNEADESGARAAISESAR